MNERIDIVLWIVFAIVLVLAIVIDLLFFRGRSANSETEDKGIIIRIDRSIIGSEIDESVLVDTETNVEYLVVDMGSSGLAITPLYNADGSLKTRK